MWMLEKKVIDLTNSEPKHVLGLVMYEVRKPQFSPKNAVAIVEHHNDHAGP